jgi:hypothetical protein
MMTALCACGHSAHCVFQRLPERRQQKAAGLALARCSFNNSSLSSLLRARVLLLHACVSALLRACSMNYEISEELEEKMWPALALCERH